MATLIDNVLITTFVSPHLFWVVETKNQTRTALLKEMREKLEKNIDDDLTPINYTFEIGQV